MNDDALYRLTVEIRILTITLARASRESLERRLNALDSGVSALQFTILHTLRFQEQTLSELSRKMMLDPSTLVPVVDALERKGLLLRGRDPQDRRRVPLSLTDAGISFVAQLLPVDENDTLLMALAAVGVEQGQQLTHLLRTLLLHMPEGEALLREVAARFQVFTTPSVDAQE